MSALNWDRDFALTQAGDDEELLGELIAIFKGSIQTDYGLIQEGLAKEDPKKIRDGAHSIKGAAASLGLLAIRDLAKDIEEDSRSGSLGVASEKMAELGELKNALLAL